VTDYDAAIQFAQDEAAAHRYKDAYNTLGGALRMGGPRDWECRYRRGVYALRVAQTRLDALEENPGADVSLSKIACWLSRSQAYLMSSSEEASAGRLDEIAAHLEDLRAQQDRFRDRWRTTARA
jgi:hypothetical protein